MRVPDEVGHGADDRSGEQQPQDPELTEHHDPGHEDGGMHPDPALHQAASKDACSDDSGDDIDRDIGQRTIAVHDEDQEGRQEPEERADDRDDLCRTRQDRQRQGSWKVGPPTADDARNPT